jgi:hypothetical protein
MKRYFTYFIALLSCCSALQATDYNEIDDEPIEKRAEAAFLLPEDHPIKSKLDEIFGDSRILTSVKHLKKAGFENPKVRNRGVVIGRHKDLKGYLLKLYLDNKDVDEVYQWEKRIQGALLIQKALDIFGYNDIMKVPKKWIYELPARGPKPSRSARYPKFYALVVEDMDIYSDPETFMLYRTSITTEHLDALYTVLTTCLLSDSTWLPNIPFAHDGKIAFIDTEFAGTSLSIWVRLPRLGKYLSSSMRRYWNNLLETRRNQKGLPLNHLEFGEYGDDEAFQLHQGDESDEAFFADKLSDDELEIFFEKMR